MMATAEVGMAPRGWASGPRAPSAPVDVEIERLERIGTMKTLIIAGGRREKGGKKMRAFSKSLEKICQAWCFWPIMWNFFCSDVRVTQVVLVFCYYTYG